MRSGTEVIALLRSLPVVPWAGPGQRIQAVTTGQPRLLQIGPDLAVRRRSRTDPGPRPCLQACDPGPHWGCTPPDDHGWRPADGGKARTWAPDGRSYAAGMTASVTTSWITDGWRSWRRRSWSRRTAAGDWMTPRQPRPARSSTAHTSDRQDRSPGRRPITLVLRRVSPKVRSIRLEWRIRDQCSVGNRR